MEASLVISALNTAALPLRPESPFILMVSGGSDSTALLVMASRAELTLPGGQAAPAPAQLHVLHVNHGIRPGEAERDEHFVADLCASLGLPCHIRRIDVPALARQNGLPTDNIEENARAGRYQLAWELAQELCSQVQLPVGCARILVAHTADDRAETFVMRSMTGAGLDGFTGMRWQRGLVLRPLLGHTRQELRDYLQKHGFSWMDDSTNDLDDALRSYVRHHVIPPMRSRIPAYAQTLGRSLDHLEEDAALLGRLADTLLLRALRPGLPPDWTYAQAGGGAGCMGMAAKPAGAGTAAGPEVAAVRSVDMAAEPAPLVLDAQLLAEAEPPLARRALMRALSRSWGEGFARRARFDSRHADRLLALARSGVGELTLPLETQAVCKDGLLQITPEANRKRRVHLAQAPEGGRAGNPPGDHGLVPGADRGVPAAGGSVILPVPGVAAWGSMQIQADLFPVPTGRSCPEFARELAAESVRWLQQLQLQKPGQTAQHTGRQIPEGRTVPAGTAGAGGPGASGSGAGGPATAGRPVREGVDFVLLDSARVLGSALPQERDTHSDPSIRTAAAQEQEQAPALCVCPAQPGMRMYPFGMNGHSKLVYDLLMEAGVPASRRPCVPVVMHQQDADEDHLASAGIQTASGRDTASNASGAGAPADASGSRPDAASVVWVGGIRLAQQGAYTAETNVLLRLALTAT